MKLRAVLGLCVAVLVAIFVGDVFIPESPLFAGFFTKYVVLLISTVVELATLGAGAFFAFRAAHRFGPQNPIGKPWRFVGGWFLAILAAQLFLAWEQLILRVVSTIPSPADAAYLVSYVCLLSSLVGFIRVYRASGFAVGAMPRWAVVAVALSLLALAALVLGPIAVVPKPLIARVINIGFPLFDLVALVLTVVLMRMLLPLRGGRVWRVWAAMLTALTLVCSGDMIFPYFYFNKWNHLESLVNLVFMAGYGAGATAAWLQDRALHRE